MLNLKRILRTGLVIGAGLLVAGVLFLTRSAGRGQCPQCGYLHDLYACKYCDWTACLGCWQQMGKHTCPGCGRGSP